MTKENNQKTTTQDKVNTYESTAPFLKSLYKEIQILSKKKPDGTLNQHKVKIINRLLSDIKTMLSGEADSKYLDLVNDEDLPQYSDVVIILSQYSAAMDKFSHRYYGWDGINNVHRWFIR
jgi:hypothetical protein